MKIFGLNAIINMNLAITPACSCSNLRRIPSGSSVWIRSTYPFLFKKEQRKIQDFQRPLLVGLCVCFCCSSWRYRKYHLAPHRRFSRGLIYGWCVKPYSSFPLCVLYVGKPPLSMIFSENVYLVEGEVGLQIFFCVRHKGKGVSSSQQQNEKRFSVFFKEFPLPLHSLLWIL